MARPGYKWHVVPSGDRWEVRREGAERASGIYDTQADAINGARGFASKAGGGEVVIHRPDGTIREAYTIPDANDPYPPPG